MNISINDALKSAETKFVPESKKTETKVADDRRSSFGDSFNKVLEKKQADAKKKLEDISKDVEGKEDEPKDLKGYLNANHLIQLYPDENTLNNEIPIESMEGFLIANGMEGLFEEGSHKFNSLMAEVEAGLLDLNADEESIAPLDLNTDEESIVPLLVKDLKEANSLNFSVEEAKANLTKALDKGLNDSEVEEIKPLEDLKGLEVKSELVAEEDIRPKEEESKDFKTIEKPISTGEKDLTSELEPLEEVTEKTIDTLDKLDTKDIEDTVVDKPIEKIDEENTNIEEPKLVDSNITFNRIQNSISGLEEMDEALSTQNIQTVEDSMIKFMKVSKDGDTTVMRVKLYPEELGSIDISLKLDKGKLVADIIVASDKIRDMFLNSSSALNRNLIEQNIPVKNINISVNDTFNNLESATGEAQEGESRGNDSRNQDTRKATDHSLSNNPIDNMRIDNINKNYIGSKSLDILV